MSQGLFGSDCEIVSQEAATMMNVAGLIAGYNWWAVEVEASIRPLDWKTVHCLVVVGVVEEVGAAVGEQNREVARGCCQYSPRKVVEGLSGIAVVLMERAVKVDTAVEVQIARKKERTVVVTQKVGAEAHIGNIEMTTADEKGMSDSGGKKTPEKIVRGT
jgi:hypothetical protein